MENTITTAVGVISIATNNKVLSKRVQTAVAKAIETCAEHGVSTEEKNNPILQECMQAARKAVKDAWPAEEEGTSAVVEVLRQHGK